MSGRIFRGWTSALTPLLAGCLLSGPAASATVDRVGFEIEPAVQSRTIESGEGFTEFLIASNAPFRVLVGGVIGDVQVQLQTHGVNNGVPFGTHAKLPGPQYACSNVVSFLESEVYASVTKTAARQGSLRQQAVQLTVRYDRHATPDIRIVPAEFDANMPVDRPSSCQLN